MIRYSRINTGIAIAKAGEMTSMYLKYSVKFSNAEIVIIIITPRNIIPEMIKCSLKFNFFFLNNRKLLIANSGMKLQIISFELALKKAFKFLIEGNHMVLAAFVNTIWDDLKAFKFLIDSKADIEAKDYNDNTSAHLASYNDNHSCYPLLGVGCYFCIIIGFPSAIFFRFATFESSILIPKTP